MCVHGVHCKCEIGIRMRIVPEVYLSVDDIIGKKEREKVGSNEVQLYYSVKQKRKKIAG